MWRRRSAEHEAAFRDAVVLWRSSGEAVRKISEQGGTLGSLRSEPRVSRASVSRRLLIGGATAAAASLATGYLVTRPPLGLWPSLEELSADYRTAKGERRNVALADGVSLTLNTQTSIAVRPRSGASSIELLSGEAAVKAARDTSQPLVIDAAGGQISATHATFNVKCLDGTVSVSCLDGVVEIAWSGSWVRLAKERQLSYSREAGLMPETRADIEQTRAWQDGLLIVRDWSVQRVIKEINRYRPGRIVVMNERLGERMISGTFHLDDLDGFIAQVHSLFGASAQALPGGIVLLS